MAARFGYDVLAVFDVRQDSVDFLASLLESGAVPREDERRLLRESLTGGAEAWHCLIECARSVQLAHGHKLDHLDGHDALAFIWAILKNPGGVPPPVRPWAETDRLIRCARELEKGLQVRPPILPAPSSHIPPAPAPPPARNDEHVDRVKTQDRIEWKLTKPSPRSARVKTADSPNDACFEGVLTNSFSESPKQETVGLKKESSETPPKTVRLRPPAGAISRVPFPPLTAARFGLIQEQVAHEPFWLLIAITFLIKTNGMLAIPAFHKVRERFPALHDLVDPANEEELAGMIQHLGLGRVRLRYIHRYARAFLERPPRAGVRYRVRNYDKRDASPPPWSPECGGDEAPFVMVGPEGLGGLEAWEIGHMTQGKYAIDSWRIFCRDELLGRATGWNGEGREPEFQPEWMRTRPDDKELRACLRWMWMREGWEWDPVTGERSVLRDEMRRAVNEGRVEYDETGGLRILG